MFYPFVWIRPAAYIQPAKLAAIKSLLQDAGYYPQYVIPITDTPRRYLILKYHQMMKDKALGRIYLRVIKESFRILAAKGGNPCQSELWFLNRVEQTMEEDYETLTHLKQYIRNTETTQVGVVQVSYQQWPVFLHCLHVPAA
jgi:hypothetical protein